MCVSIDGYGWEVGCPSPQKSERVERERAMCVCVFVIFLLYVLCEVL